MKPRSLAMTAFGPFGGREVIDFSRLEGRDLVLIEGPTGAGKTSILDAICYALFGHVPGAREEARSELRSAFADPSLSCEVTFDFELRGHTYRVRRSPEQVRPRKRGSGTTVQGAEAHLFELVSGQEKPLASKLSEVDAKVRAIVGLDETQFQQVLLLPQGEFRKFLLAQSTDKEKLLEHLFKTSTYRAVADALGEQKRMLEREATDLQRLRDETLRQRGVDSLAALDEAIDEARTQLAMLSAQAEEAEQVARVAQAAFATATHVEALHRALGEAQARAASIDDDRPRIADHRARLALYGQAQVLGAQLERVVVAREAHAQARTALDAHQRALADIERRAAEAEQRASELPALDEALTLARSEHVRLQSLLDVEREARLVDERHALARTDADQARAKAERERAIAVRARAALETHDAEASQARTLAQGASELAVSLERATQQRRKADEQAARTTRLREVEAELSTVTKLHIRTKKSAAQLARDLDRQRAARESGMAGELAAHLSSGERCPVCGSTEHPAKAATEGPFVTREAIDALARAQVDAQAALSELDQRRARLDTEREHLLDPPRQPGPDDGELLSESELHALRARALKASQAEKRAAELDVARPAVLDAAEASARVLQEAEEQARRCESEAERQRTLLASLRKHLGEASVAARLSAVSAEIARGEARVRDITQASRDSSTARSTARELQDAKLAAVQGAAGQLARETQALEVAAKVHGFASAEEAEGARLPLHEHERLREEVESFVAREASSLQDLERLEREAVDAPPVDAEALRAAAEEAGKQAREAIDGHASLRATLAELEKARRIVTERDEAYARIDRELRVLGRLASVVSGDNQLKMSLQRFVLASRMDEVAVAASHRLHRMSRGRYRLLRTDDVRHRGRGSGLDLAVDDAHTGTTRSVHSLSGGEMFLASLSLALGLADVVTRRSGGVHLDTLFIDEGFGSLDDETLDQVMRALEDLREGGRLVGMISHVAELKERIPTRLLVQRGERGSTTAWRV